MTAPTFASHAPRKTSTPVDVTDAAVAHLASRKDAWVKVPASRRAELLRQCIERTRAVAPDWVNAACRAKGIDPMASLAGEEWLAGPMPLVRNLRLLAEALDEDGRPVPPTIKTLPSGQYAARVFPKTLFDRLSLSGVTADIWIEPGKEPTQGRIYREKARGVFPPGKVSLVLGAGNVASIGPMDVLHKLFVEDEVVIVKMNPVNEYLLPFWEESLRPLVDAGVLAFVRGGAALGQHLVDHPDIETIHLTGSDQTYDAIVWGASAEERVERKKSGNRRTTKDVTSELGCVTPVLVVPGPWSDSDIDYQARQVAGMVANNASFNCNAAQMLVVADGWVQRRAFLDRVEHHLSQTPPRSAYYPGAQKRFDAFLERYPSAVMLGSRSPTVVPWTVIPGVPAEPGEFALTSEAFCGVLGHTALKASDAKSFLDAMLSFANDACWGTLSCVVLIHPETERKHREQFARVISELRYGGIAINAWAGVIFGLASPSWGAFPGHPPEDIRSGSGTVHNTFLFDHPQKTVLRAPFRMPVTPPWFADHKNVRELGATMVKFEAHPSWATFPPVALAGLRG